MAGNQGTNLGAATYIKQGIQPDVVIIHQLITAQRCALSGTHSKSLE